MSASSPQPTVTWHPFKLGLLEKYLGLTPPPFTHPENTFRQLRYVEQYANDLKCSAVAIESHYIDRDYIEDHSVFYSKCLYPFSNSCRRVHFFSVDEVEAQARIRALVGTGVRLGSPEFKRECQAFSGQAYLGFAVIKPLDGSPVGRTVLRCFPDEPDEADRKQEFRRDFRCTRMYTGHLLGVELSVHGLAFQQQDVGVSACATTAIWSSLQKTGDHEEIAHSTPAQITTLATKYSLTGGRPMPSDGLNLDQMCQAVQAVGVARICSE